jgi:hypothetical protein
LTSRIALPYAESGARAFGKTAVESAVMWRVGTMDGSAACSRLAAASIGCLAFSFVLGWVDSAAAQQPAPQADPGDFGLVLPDDPPLPGGGRRALVLGADGQLVVSQVHVEVGDRFVVVMPNGRLNSVPKADATLTDRPFAPATKEEIIAELTAEKFAGFRTRSTNRYLYVYNTSEPFYQATSRILETMYPALLAYCKRQKIEVHDPETPLIAIMFKTEAEFNRYREMPEGVVAYYNGVTNYVVMYEQSALADLAPDLAIKQSISTIAHEGVHQILHNIGVQQRLSRWPMWISEGLPEYFAPTQVDKRVKWKGVGLVNDLRMHNLLEFLKQQPGGTTRGELVRATAEAEQLDSTGYAAAWALTHYLAKFKKDAFFNYLRDVSKFQALEQRSEDDIDLFKRHFGSDFAELEKGLHKNLSKLPYVDPIMNQTHFVATITAGGRTRVMMTTSPAAIKAVISATPGARYTVDAFPDRATASVAYQAAVGN